MNVPKLRFKEFDGEWKPQKLENFIQFFSGLTYSPDDVLNSGGTLVLRSSNIQSGSIVNADNVYVKSEVVNSENVLKGDIVVVVRNGSRNLIGKHAQVKEDMPDTVIGAFMTGLRSDEPNFLNILLDTKQFQKEIHKNLGATINQITTGAFKRMSFVISDSIGEQKKIGSFFSTIDKKIQLQQEKIDLLKEQKKGFMQKIFSQELRFKDEDEQDFPKWTTNILTHFALVNPKSEELSPEFRYIDLEAVVDGELLSTQVISKQSAPSRAQRVVRKGDILYQTVRPYQKNNLLYNHDFSEQVVASTGYAQIKAKENTDSAFLYQLMNTEKFTYYVLQRCTGTSYPAINSSDLGEIEIQMPVLKEQQKIAVFLSKVDKKVAIERNKLKTLQHQKQAFMQQMFI